MTVPPTAVRIVYGLLFIASVQEILIEVVATFVLDTVIIPLAFTVFTHVPPSLNTLIVEVSPPITYSVVGHL